MAEEPEQQRPERKEGDLPADDYDPAKKFTIQPGGVEWDKKPDGLGEEES